MRGLNSSFTGCSPTLLLLLATLMVDTLPAAELHDRDDERLRLRPATSAEEQGSWEAMSLDSLLMSWMMQ